MSTIAKRLREIADTTERYSDQPSRWVAENLRKIASELEAAPAADAVPVVGALLTPDQAQAAAFFGLEGNCTPLVRQSDHLSAIAALQARFAELEARQVPDGWVAVPREPTPEMLAACHSVDPVSTSMCATLAEADALNNAAFYRAMLAAAPSNPTTQPPEGR